MLKIDRDKYIGVLRSEGVNAAITCLHRDTERWEYQAFEGENGWQPEMWHELEEVRKFSRELWEMALQSQNPHHNSKQD